MGTLLAVEQLEVRLFDRSGVVLAVRGVDLTIGEGEVVALVGESGCGKSVTALALLRLLPADARIQGSAHFQGRDLLSMPIRELRSIRGSDIAMVFQEPMSSLNPAFTIGNQIIEVLKRHKGLRGASARQRAAELLNLVRIGAPEQRLRAYPHQLSGGMRQRAMIAMALACDPKLLILDEPTTALDVTTQAQILDIVRDLQQRLGMSILLITHDLGVVADLADRVAVMYAGAKVEDAEVGRLFASPRHPYTAGLLRALPRLNFQPGETRQRLTEIPGMVPVLRAHLDACAFAPRCPRAEDDCHLAKPGLEACDAKHVVACFHPEPVDTRVASS
ncbi:MAG TPA: ABC transporter ATP-binding protein [Candidatus Nanopelagicaceae bacterium]|nr:ABC transporter ATP-binding protein [Candidatus Nanopelagicaceae bacterium]